MSEQQGRGSRRTVTGLDQESTENGAARLPQSTFVDRATAQRRLRATLLGSDLRHGHAQRRRRQTC